MTVAVASLMGCIAARSSRAPYASTFSIVVARDCLRARPSSSEFVSSTSSSPRSSTTSGSGARNRVAWKMSGNRYESPNSSSGVPSFVFT